MEPHYTNTDSQQWSCSRNRSHQPYISELINAFAPKGIGVEIGVNEGQLSYYLLQNTDIEHLYLIDPWITWRGWSPQSTLENRYKFCSETLPDIFPNRTSTIRKASSKAPKHVPNELDFIFIDGNHGYEFVKKDLELWIPKVKSGGLVSGHDWSHSYVGVVRAVIEYCTSHRDTFVEHFSDYKSLNLNLRYKPAPAINPIVNKSATGAVWWTIKK